MYDIQLIVPCIEERLSLFQKLGICNIKDRKVFLYCLVSKNKSIFHEGWPDGVDFEVVEYPYKNENFRLFTFLSELGIDKANQAKWTAKLDDDSYTDIDFLCRNLDYKYNHEEDYYIAGYPIRNENNYTEYRAVKESGLLEKINNCWTHELEFCVLSQSAFSKIINNEDCKKIFSLFAKFNEEKKQGYTDQLMGAAAKLCDIKVIDDETIKYAGTKKDAEFILSFTHFHPVNYDVCISIAKKLNRNLIIRIEEKFNKQF